MIKDASIYFLDGCGRCDLFATDLCKARKWSEPLHVLREILLATGLHEEVKWGQPTYTLKGKNVAMLFALKTPAAYPFSKAYCCAMMESYWFLQVKILMQLIYLRSLRAQKLKRPHIGSEPI